jgi:hypothetical protein
VIDDEPPRREGAEQKRILGNQDARKSRTENNQFLPFLPSLIPYELPSPRLGASAVQPI